MSVYIVNGKPYSGKTTFEYSVQHIMGKEYCRIYSIIDPIKSTAKMFGWNGEKTPKNRKFLSDLKDVLTEWNNYPYNSILKKVKSLMWGFEEFGVPKDKYAIFIDCREPEEIKNFVKDLEAKTILVTRDSVDDTPASNHADADVLNYDYNIEIKNNGNLRDLTYLAIDFIKKEGLRLMDVPYTVDLFGNITYT